MKGAQMASRNHKYKHEFSGIFGKRFVTGWEEHHKSTHEERQETIRLWKEKGFETRVRLRGDLKDRTFECPLTECDLDKPHKHVVDGDADIPRLHRHRAT
jgi:hypothetical protein